MEVWYTLCIGSEEAQRMAKSDLRCVTLSFKNDREFVTKVPRLVKVVQNSPKMVEQAFHNAKSGIEDRVLEKEIHEMVDNLYMSVDSVNKPVPASITQDNIMVCTEIVIGERRYFKWYMKN